MGMRDKVSAETKLQDEVIKAILEFKSESELKHRGDAIEMLIKLGIARKNSDTHVPTRFESNFESKEGRVGFSIAKRQAAFSRNYANHHNIDYQVAYFEFICCGLLTAGKDIFNKG